MTKKERAEFDAALLKARTVAALRWTSPVKPDVAPPTEYPHRTEGWDYNVAGRRVWAAWSSSVSHGRGPAPKEGERHYSSSQGCRSLYSTERLALAALRHEVEKQAAYGLAAIDNLIDRGE